MRQLIRFELRKALRARVLFICAIVLVCIVVLFIGIDKLTDMGLEEMGISSSGMEMELEEEEALAITEIMGFGFFNNSGMTRMLSALSNIYVIVIFGAFTAVFTCGDFGNTTIKNIFTKGYSRTEVFFAQYLTCLIVTVCYAVLVFITGFICGTLFWKAGDNWKPVVIVLLFLQLLAAAAFNALFCFFSAWLKRMGPAIVLSIAVPVGIPLILSLTDLLMMENSLELSRFWLGGSIQLVSSVSASQGDMALSLAVSLIYLAVFTVLGWLLCRKREV